MIFKPWDYQRFAINHVIDHEASGLFLDMGLGKTVTTLTAIDDLILLGEVKKVLVIAPKRVAEDTWSTEVDKWDHLKHLRISKIIGTPQQRTNACYQDADIYVLGRDNVKAFVDQFITCWKWDMVVIDELSSFKSSKSQRFRALKKVRGYFKRIVGLTGTPAPNSLIDLWPQLYLLDGGKRLGRTITGYKQQYFSAGQSNGYVVYNWNLKEGSEETIKDRISDICISMKAEDYLNMPERIDNRIEIELPKKALEHYKKLEKDYVMELGEDEITATNAATLTGKLLQMANGAIYKEDKYYLWIHDEKIEKLLEIIDTANKPVLVFYNFKSDRERIIAALNKKGIKDYQGLDSSEDIKKWNEGKIQVALLHPASAGHGLNLQYGGNIIVWFGLTWSLELYQQANARLYRQGQKETVIIHHLISKVTVDENVMKALENKDIGQSALLEAVKARIKEVKKDE